MSDMYMFGVGIGRLSKREIARRKRIARRNDAEFVALHGANAGQCICGYGCRMDHCPVMSYWFQVRNMGEPFNSATRRSVESAL